jgi:septal ring factor EnvC (AmiA/AmiB activator)
MFMETPQTLIYLVGGAFLLGWLVGKVGAYFGNRIAAKKSDPRDGRIRSLDADVRVAQTDAEKTREDLEERGKELAEQKTTVNRHDAKIKEQALTIARLRVDLKDSVKKTRELRAELSDRATENVRSEVMLREVQTELSVAHASTDMIATGVLDYSVAPSRDEQPAKAKSAK